MRAGRSGPMLLTMAAFLVLAAGAAVVAVGAGAAGGAARAVDRHALLHVGCAHHAHGPRWHDGHAASLGHRKAAGDGDLAGRSLTATRAHRPAD